MSQKAGNNGVLRPAKTPLYCTILLLLERMDKINIKFHPWDESHFIFLIKNIMQTSQEKWCLRVYLWFCLSVEQKISHFLWTKVFRVFSSMLSSMLYCWIDTKCDPILKHRSLWSFCCANWGKKRTDTNLVTRTVPLSQRPNLDTSYFEPPWKW